MLERSCPYNHERLTAYASGNLSHVERSDMEHHLALCAECRQELNDFQKTWLALDLWQAESTPAAPRLQDLRFRIAASKRSQSSWDKIRNSLRLRQGLFRLAPAMTFASVMGALFLYPWMQTQMAVVQNDAPESHYSSELVNMAAEALTRADVKQNDLQIAQNNENALSERELEQQFNDAIRSSAPYQREKNRMLANARPMGSLDTRYFTNVGYRPSATIIPAHENSDALKPSALYQTNNDQSIRLGD